VVRWFGEWDLSLLQGEPQDKPQGEPIL